MESSRKSVATEPRNARRRGWSAGPGRPDTTAPHSGANAKAWKQGKPEIDSFEKRETAARFRLGNTLTYRELPKPAQGGFHLSFDAAHTNYQRYFVIALTDKEGKRGYGIGWDSSRPDIAGETGFVRLLKFDEAKPLGWDLKGKTLAQGTSAPPRQSPKRWPGST